MNLPKDGQRVEYVEKADIRSWKLDQCEMPNEDWVLLDT